MQHNNQEQPPFVQLMTIAGGGLVGQAIYAAAKMRIPDLLGFMTQGGKERTEKEYRDLYSACGFKLNRIVPTRSPISVVEGERV